MVAHVLFQINRGNISGEISYNSLYRIYMDKYSIWCPLDSTWKYENVHGLGFCFEFGFPPPPPFIFFKETTLLMCRALGFRDHLDSRGVSVLSFSKLKHILNMSGLKANRRKNEIFKKLPSLVSDFKAGLCLGMGKTVSKRMFCSQRNPLFA